MSCLCGRSSTPRFFTPTRPLSDVPLTDADRITYYPGAFSRRSRKAFPAVDSIPDCRARRQADALAVRDHLVSDGTNV